MKFIKMHGIGNDYIYIDCFSQEVDIEKIKPNISKLSDRHFGIGGDGVIFICPSEVADAKMRMFNADGSESQMCGNGIRCVAKYVYDSGICRKDTLTIETLDGVKTLNLTVKNSLVDMVTVNMGIPKIESAKIPAKSKLDKIINQKLMIGNNDFFITCVSMGNPHCVIFTHNIDSIELEEIGPQIEKHEMFPEHTNVEFIEVLDHNTLKMRVWERGTGETLACGTGASASVVAAVLNGFCKKNEEVTVHLRGGDLVINYHLDGHVYMTGPAVVVFDGEIDINNL